MQDRGTGLAGLQRKEGSWRRGWKELKIQPWVLISHIDNPDPAGLHPRTQGYTHVRPPKTKSNLVMFLQTRTQEMALVSKVTASPQTLELSLDLPRLLEWSCPSDTRTQCVP